MNVMSAASMAEAARTAVLVLPAAVPLAVAFRRLDPLLIARSRWPWAAAVTGGVLGALLVVCVHGLLHSVYPGISLGAGTLAWCGGYMGVWSVALALLLAARGLRRGRPAGPTAEPPTAPGRLVPRGWPGPEGPGPRRGVR